MAKEAFLKGAKLIITQKKCPKNKFYKAISHIFPINLSNFFYSQILVKDTRKAAAILAKLFFDNPSKKFTLIGITGTNGKTSICKFLEQIFLLNNKKVGTIGTLGHSILGENFPSERTTPDTIELNKIFNKMVEAKVEYVVMEISSHAVSLDRIYALNFAYGIFINLSEDHLDFHKTMENYALAKYRFFDYLLSNSGKGIVNIDDDYGKNLYLQKESKNQKKHSKEKGLFSFSLKENSDFKISNINYLNNKSSFEINFKNNKYKISSSLIGEFNVYNLGLAYACILLIDNKFNLDLKITFPLSRLEKIENAKNLNIFVDYAHTPIALEKALSTLKKMKEKKIITIVGAGGNRDKEKRPKMGKICLELSDFVVFTNDNPRDENANQIIRELSKNIEQEENWIIIRDRKKAVQFALSIAREKDILLFAGKGEEKYIEDKSDKIPYYEKEEIKKALAKENDDLEFFDIMNLEKLFKLNNFADDFPETYINNFCLSSLDTKRNSLFFALKGKNFDGHDFIKEVLDKESFILAEKQINFSDKKIIYTPSVIQAYQRLAKKYSNYFINCQKIGITGSVGKTTTKEMIFNLLEKKYPNTIKTYENENNLLGVPKTLFKIKANTNFAIIELGTNHKGEIESTSKLICPDIGIITNIEPAHLEYFENIEEIYKEKISLFKYSKEKIFSKDISFFENLKGISVGYKENNENICKLIKIKENSLTFSLNNQEYSLNSIIPYHVYSASIALIVGKHYGFSKDELKNFLQKKILVKNRMQIENKDEKIIFWDCYNASPKSMQEAIKFWLSYKKNLKHYAILGDMLELGEKSIDFHKQIALLLPNKNNIISVGKYSLYYDAKKHFTTVEDLINSNIFNKYEDKSVWLIKASFSISLNKLKNQI